MKTDVQKIRAFIRVAKALERSKFYSTTKTVGVRAVPRKDNKRAFKCFGFEEDQFRSALLDFRKIYADREETNFFRICNVIELSSLPEALKETSRNLRKEFYDELNEHETNYDGKNKDTPKVVLDKWMNGKYFHQDHAKRTNIERMNFIRIFHKLQFVATVWQLGLIAIKLSKALDAHLKGPTQL
jgi:hypothetical protein